MTISKTVLAVVLMMTMGAASGVSSQAGSQTGTASISGLPATFVGRLPCADCAGVQYQLNLWPDRVYFLRRSYQGRSGTFDDIGSWAISSDGRTLALRGGLEGPELFALKGANTLRKLDFEGREIESALNYDLTRASSLEPFEPRLRMRGMYRYMADAGRFVECTTRRDMLVAQQGDNAALESAYSKAREQPNEPLVAVVEGRIAERPRVEGGGTEQVLVPEKFLSVSRGESCGRRFATAELLDTYWKLTRLGAQAVVVEEGRQEPHLLLHLERSSAAGSTGCNRIAGTYRVEGPSILVGPLSTTRMACPGKGGEEEAAFVEALTAARRWSARGEHLELYDEAGNLLARFEARYTR